MKSNAKIFEWLKKRSQNDLFNQFVIQKTVPIDRFSIRYYLGGAIIFLFILQVLTGILLGMHYIPTIQDAFKSMELITSRVEFGWLIRSIHIWSSHLMVTLLFLHMFTTFTSRAYRSPRELTWISGCILFGIVLAICFFGYLLPWNDRSFSATCAGIQIMQKFPLIGENIVHVVQGASEFTGNTLTRFSVIHMIILPSIFLIVMTIHLFLIQIHGISEPLAWQHISNEKNKRRLPFFPNFIQRILLFWIVLANIVLFLAIFSPSELGEEANRFIPAPINIKPEWYFLFLYKTLKLMPAHVIFFEGEMLMLGLFFLGAIFILIIPFIDSSKATIKRSKLIRLFAVLFFIYIITMTIWGYLD